MRAAQGRAPNSAPQPTLTHQPASLGARLDSRQPATAPASSRYAGFGPPVAVPPWRRLSPSPPAREGRFRPAGAENAAIGPPHERVLLAAHPRGRTAETGSACRAVQRKTTSHFSNHATISSKRTKREQAKLNVNQFRTGIYFSKSTLRCAVPRHRWRSTVSMLCSFSLLTLRS